MYYTRNAKPIRVNVRDDDYTSGFGTAWSYFICESNFDVKLIMQKCIDINS